MKRLEEFLKRHQLVSYFILTYFITWTLLLVFQPIYLAGERLVAPLISMAVFGPALAGIGLSALVKPLPRQGSRKPVLIAFVVAWILASLVITLYLVINQGMDLTPRLVIVNLITALLPAFVVSSMFSRVPGVQDLLRSYIKPKGHFGYYILAFFLIPLFWLGGNLISRALGTDMPFFRAPVVDAGLLGLVLLFFLYNVVYGALSEEPGWRGFALPRLQARFSPLVSSLILGVIWAVWHSPGKFGGIEASSISDTITEWILIVMITIIFTWLYNRTRGSILVTALIHPAMNTTGNFLNASLGALVLLLAFMIFVIVFDKMWKKLPADHSAVYAAGARSR